jgi:ankyrin repeat protein
MCQGLSQLSHVLVHRLGEKSCHCFSSSPRAKGGTLDQGERMTRAVVDTDIAAVCLQSPCSKDLYELCVKRQWHKVVRHCQTQPGDARYQDNDGNTPLHIACKHRPSVRVVLSLLEAFPASTMQFNAAGDLPLHEACRSNASVSVLREITKFFPGTASLENNKGATAVNILCNSRDSTETNLQSSNSDVLWHTTKEDLQNVNYASVFWQKMQVLLEAAACHRGLGPEGTMLLVLHAAVALSSCPIQVLMFCLSQYPDQINQRDVTGQLPLHIAVANRNKQRDDTLPLQLRKLQPRGSCPIIRLLELYPEAAGQQDPNEPIGRTPLHTALAHGHEWHTGVKELFQYAPDAAYEVDPVTRLQPFQMAAENDVDTCYQLLRNNPFVAMGLRIAPKFLEHQKTSENSLTRTNSVLPKARELGVIVTESSPASFEPQQCLKRQKSLSAPKKRFSSRFLTHFSSSNVGAVVKTNEAKTSVVNSVTSPKSPVQREHAASHKAVPTMISQRAQSSAKLMSNSSQKKQSSSMSMDSTELNVLAQNATSSVEVNFGSCRNKQRQSVSRRKEEQIPVVRNAPSCVNVTSICAQTQQQHPVSQKSIESYTAAQNTPSCIRLDSIPIQSEQCRSVSCGNVEPTSIAQIARAKVPSICALTQRRDPVPSGLRKTTTINSTTVSPANSESTLVQTKNGIPVIGSPIKAVSRIANVAHPPELQKPAPAAGKPIATKSLKSTSCLASDLAISTVDDLRAKRIMFLDRLTAQQSGESNTAKDPTPSPPVDQTVEISQSNADIAVERHDQHLVTGEELAGREEVYATIDLLRSWKSKPSKSPVTAMNIGNPIISSVGNINMLPTDLVRSAVTNELIRSWKNDSFEFPDAKQKAMKKIAEMVKDDGFVIQNENKKRGSKLRACADQSNASFYCLGNALPDAINSSSEIASTTSSTIESVYLLPDTEKSGNIREQDLTIAKKFAKQILEAEETSPNAISSNELKESTMQDTLGSQLATSKKTLVFEHRTAVPVCNRRGDRLHAYNRAQSPRRCVSNLDGYEADSERRIKRASPKQFQGEPEQKHNYKHGSDTFDSWNGRTSSLNTPRPAKYKKYKAMIASPNIQHDDSVHIWRKHNFSSKVLEI